MKLTANDIGGIFGTIAPPPGTPGGSSDPVTAISSLFSFGLQFILVIAAISLLIYLLWGAMDWLFSNGEKEKLAKAQNKIIENTNGGWRLIIPTIAP